MATAKKATQDAAGTEAGHDALAAYRGIAWAVLLGVMLLLTAALISHDPADFPGHAVGVHNPTYHNWVGQFGAMVSHKLLLVLGPGVWVVVLAVGGVLGSLAFGRRVDQPVLRTLGVLVMMLSVSGLAAAGLPVLLPNVETRPEGAGGLIGVLIHEQMRGFGLLGTLVVLMVCFWVGAILAADRLVLAVPRLAGEALLRLFNIQARLPRPRFAWVGRLPGAAWLGWLGERWRTWTDRGEPEGRATDLDDFEGDEEDGEGGEGAGGGEAKGRKGKVVGEGVPLRRSGGLLSGRGKAAEPVDEEAGGVGASEAFDVEPDAKVEVVGAGIVDPDVGGEVGGAGTATEVAAPAEGDEDENLGDAPAAYIEDSAETHGKFDPEALREKMARLPINFAPKQKNAAAGGGGPREVDLSGYQFPGLDLLEEPEGNFTAEMEQIVRDQAMQLESALKEYGIEGEVVGIDSGPVITMFEVRLAPGTKSARLSNVADDLARALKAQNIRIVPVIAGKDTVGVEVPNIKKERVRLKELMTANPDKLAKMKLPMFLGKDASGTPLVGDLNAMPHMLIAGTTGSGKSVCMNSIIMSFLFTKRPDELKLVLVDPKMVEMSMFKDIPHLMCPVVTEMAKAASILEWAVTKMDERYELLAEVGVRDIATYNELGWDEIKERMAIQSDEEAARVPKKLPYLVFVIDELADLMMTNKEVEGHIVRIAQKARAVGMHLILATQRPQANVVTGLIKSNMPCRVCMKVSSGMDSRIVLDQKGGELLLGHGDMLFLSPRSSDLSRAQGTLVDDAEIRKTVRFLKEISEPSFEPQLVQIKGNGEIELDEERDELFDAAVRIVIETNRGSVSLLQRRLAIGYSRASRIIEQIAQAGILGDHKGTVAREVTITLEEWDAMQAQAAADAAKAEAEADTDEAESDGDGAAASAAVPPPPTPDDLAYNPAAVEVNSFADDEEDDDAVPAEYGDEYRQ